MFEEFAEMLRESLPEGWDIDDDIYGMECLLVAPDGCMIEQDGHCPHGYVSPLRTLGFI